jgi:hypothetical protein
LTYTTDILFNILMHYRIAYFLVLVYILDNGVTDSEKEIQAEKGKSTTALVFTPNWQESFAPTRACKSSLDSPWTSLARPCIPCKDQISNDDGFQQRALALQILHAPQQNEGLEMRHMRYRVATLLRPQLQRRAPYL